VARAAGPPGRGGPAAARLAGDVPQHRAADPLRWLAAERAAGSRILGVELADEAVRLAGEAARPLAGEAARPLAGEAA
jgi:hypothetical protein